MDLFAALFNLIWTVAFVGLTIFGAILLCGWIIMGIGSLLGL
jgi:hypothetical protein